MTNGTVLILGSTGKNFGAGMSGGLAFVLDLEEQFKKLYNDEMIEVVPLDDDNDIKFVKSLIYSHLEATESERAKDILADWETYRKKFHKVQPKSGIAVPQKEDEAKDDKNKLAKKS